LWHPGWVGTWLVDFDKDIHQLIADIHWRLTQAALGPAPRVAQRNINSGYSPAATAVAKLFVERTARAVHHDPMLPTEEVAEITGLSEDDVADALYELKGMIEDYDGALIAQPELFTTFDKHFKDWDPAADALCLAADLLNDPAFPREPHEIAARYDWLP
jgi:hypothetical protein